MGSARSIDSTRDPRRDNAGLRRRLRSPGRFDAFVAILVAAAVATSFLIVPRMRTSGSPLEPLVEELGRDASPPGAQISPSARLDSSQRQLPIVENVDGYAILPGGEGSVTLPVRVKVADDDRAFLRLWVYGSQSVPVRVEVLRGHTPLRLLGTPGVWAGKRFDMTDELAGGPIAVRVSARSRGSAPALFFDRISAITVPQDATPRVGAALVGAWLALVAAAGLGIIGWLRRHWPLVFLVAFAGGMFWRGVQRESVVPLGRDAAELWAAASGAHWLDVNSGLVSGTFGAQSALAVQLFHAVRGVVGTGTGGALAASALVGVAAVVALYWLGYRVAGRVSAVAVPTLALLAEPFREAAISGTAVTTLVLAAVLFAYAIHASLAVASPPAIAALAVTGAIAVLAEALWLPGLVVGIAILVSLYAPDGTRMRSVAISLAALALLLVPSRLSAAKQHDGDIFGDLADRATLARSIERAGEGVPPERKRVGVTEYVFADRSVGVVTGEALTGASDAVDALSDGGETRLAGLLALLFGAVGAAYLLIVPRLRMLVIVPTLVALPALVFVGRDAMSAFAGAVPPWTALLAGGGLLAYVLTEVAGARLPVRERRPQKVRSGRPAPSSAVTPSGAEAATTAVGVSERRQQP
jgi:hypothetical protein